MRILALCLIWVGIGAVVGDLTNYLNEAETQLDMLHDAALKLHRQKCSLDCTHAFDSNPYACSTHLTTANGSSCSADYGIAYYTSEPGCLQCSNRNINRYFSTVLTPSDKASCSDKLNNDICWTKGLEGSVQSTNIEGGRWNLIATGNGFIRLYPGVPQDQCYSYDPRQRSWYAAASTGPKDIVILIDSSSSMEFVPSDSKNGESRMDIAKRAVNHVLGTLTFVDYVAVIEFSTEAHELPVDGVYTLIQATKKNIQALSQEVNQIHPDGHTNFEQAFRLAFDMFDRSATVDRTTGCHKVILFLTDGSPTRGEQDPAKLSQIITAMNTGPNGEQIANMFSYSIGEIRDGETRQEILHTIACDNNGLTSEVETDGVISLQDQLSQYHDYYSTLHTGSSHIVWTEPYLDSFGAAQVITLARAVYDDNATSASSGFVGVVAVDISYDHIMELESDYSKLLASLRERQMTCPRLEVSRPCDLETLRQKVYDEGVVIYIPDDNKVCNTTSMCSLPNNQVCNHGPTIYENCQQHKSASHDYKREACCGAFEECPTSATPRHNINLALVTCLSVFWSLGLVQRTGVFR